MFFVYEHANQIPAKRSVLLGVCLEDRGKNFTRPQLEAVRKHFSPTLPAKAMFSLVRNPQNFLGDLYEYTAMLKKSSDLGEGNTFQEI
jgi:hypothetical protein